MMSGRLWFCVANPQDQPCLLTNPFWRADSLMLAGLELLFSFSYHWFYFVCSKVWRNSQTEVWQQGTGAWSSREEGHQEYKCCKISRIFFINNFCTQQMILNYSFLKSYNRYLQEICQCCGPSPPVMEWWQQWHLCSVRVGRGPPLPVGGRGLETGNSLASATAPSNNSFLKIFIYAWHEIQNFIWKQLQSFAW